MSYVKDPFQHDIFVSYSHGNVDGTDDSALKAWSRGFVKVLEAELKTAGSAAYTSELARDVSIFFDQDHRSSHGIDPMEALGAQLESKVGDAAVLVILACRQYLESEWCTKERDWWIQRQQALGFPFLNRVAAAHIYRNKLTWPNPLADASGALLAVGFNFFDTDPSKDRPQEWPEPLLSSRGPFRDEIVRMVGVIGEKLFALRQRLAERVAAAADAAKLQADDGQVIYLHGRVTQTKAWDHAFDSLTSSGFSVFPTAPEPTTNDAEGVEKIRQQRVETMSGCDALLLLATEDGAAADADLVVVGRQDRNSAKARSRRLIPCALLDTAGSPIATPKRTVAARSLRVQWIDATRDPWTPAVKQWLTTAGAGGGE